MAKIELSLTSSQVEEIKKVPIEKTPIYMELFSKEWVKDLKLSKKTPIEYTDKEDITSIAFYRDKDCKEAIKGFVESGQTIYARVTTRGLDDSDIALFIYKHGTVTEEETSTKGGVYKVSGETDAKGITVLKIKIEWCKKPMGWTTYKMIEYAEKNPKWLIKHNDPNYIPKRGDIFLWYGKRVDKKGVSHYSGHTGVVINYNSESDIVTTIEAIQSSVKNEKAINERGEKYKENENKKLAGTIKMHFFRKGFHLIGHNPVRCYFYTFAVHYSKK